MTSYSVPQSSAGAVSGLFYVPPNIPQYMPQQQQLSTSSFYQHQQYGQNQMYFAGNTVSGLFYVPPNVPQYPQQQPPPTSSFYQQQQQHQQYRQHQIGFDENRYPQKSRDNSARPPIKNSHLSAAQEEFPFLTPQLLPANAVHPKFKTEMCNKYGSNSGCPYGSSCHFRHPEDPAYPEVTAQRFRGAYQNSSGNGRNLSSQMNFGSGDRKQKSPQFQFSTSQLVPAVSKIQIDQQTKYSIAYPQKNHVNSFRLSNKNSRSNGAEGHFQFLALQLSSNGVHPKFKTEMCNKFGTSRGCQYGKSCQYRHPDDPAYPVINTQRFQVCRKVSDLGRIRSPQMNYRSVDHKQKKKHVQFLSENTLPKFIKFASKVPKNGMRRHNSADTIGHFTYIQVSNFKKRLNEEKGIKSKGNCL